MALPRPDTIQVRSLPGDGFETAFQARCPQCDSLFRAVFDKKKRQAGRHKAAPCPACRADLGNVVDKALSDRRLEELRGHPYRVRDISDGTA